MLFPKCQRQVLGALPFPEQRLIDTGCAADAGCGSLPSDLPQKTVRVLSGLSPLMTVANSGSASPPLETIASLTWPAPKRLVSSAGTVLGSDWPHTLAGND